MLFACGVVAGAAVATDPLPAIQETVVVTASSQPQRLVDAVALVSVVSRAELLANPSLVLDGRLAQVPGFGLFRRTSSLGAHPTSQGVSLRGLGSNGASRSLVLLDGMPLNDPFGGWVAWNRIPGAALDSVEVLRGATSQLYGSAAMAGTIQLLTRAPAAGVRQFTTRVGSGGTWDVEGLAAGKRERAGYLAAGRVFDTAGYFATPPDLRGAVDRPIDVASRAFFARALHGAAHASLHVFDEARHNGTLLQHNRSQLQALELGIVQGAWRGSGWGQRQRLRSTFSSVSSDRERETALPEQDFRSWAAGAAISHDLGGGLIFGGDWRRVEWQGHTQTLAGGYAQKTAQPSARLELLAGVRLDVWQNQATQAAVDPRLGAIFRPSGHAALRASLYRGFRAPTLNELFRPFRVGNVDTEANPALRDEHLIGADAGVDLYPSGALLLRVNGFWNQLRDPIGNVTLRDLGSLILRRRDNLGRVRVAGVESEARVRLRSGVSGRVSYLFSASSVAATGLQLAQSPRHAASLGLGYERTPRMDVQARWLGNQFDDDRNLLPLGQAWSFDASASYPLRARLRLLLAAENLAGRRVVTGRVPFDQLGPPRLVTVGLRFE